MYVKHWIKLGPAFSDRNLLKFEEDAKEHCAESSFPLEIINKSTYMYICLHESAWIRPVVILP